MTRPFASLAQEAHLNIARAAAELEHTFEGAFKAYGITNTQFNVLHILRGAGRDGLCRTEIGERMIRRVPDVTRLLDRLEQTALITRERVGDDRRFVVARITAKGMALLERLDGEVYAMHEHLAKHMTTAQLKTLVQLMNELREPL
jgi:DNA-binding MarR family transcriptional regulator